MKSKKSIVCLCIHACRYGFNSSGHEVVVERVASLRKTCQDKDKPIVLGINLGKNKVSPVDSVDDYLVGVKTFGSLADYLVINVSSPNTAGLRSLQEKTQLNTLVHQVVEARNALNDSRPPVILKIAPDLTTEDKHDIAEVVVKVRNPIVLKFYDKL